MLIDDVLVLSPQEQERLLPYSYQDLERAQVYEIGDVARVGLTHISHADRLTFSKDLPNIAPLAPVVWMEFDLAGLPDAPFLGTDIRSYGVLLRAFDRRDPEDGVQVGTLLRLVGHDPDDAVRWFVLSSVLWRFADNGEISSRPHLVGHAVRPDGSVEGQYNALDREGQDTPLSVNMRNIIITVSFFASLAVTFAHCHNVPTSLHQPTRQQRRFRERQGQPALRSWHTIDVPGITQMLREHGGLEQHGLKHALHLVRANFATYTPEAPLFGKYVGTFYRPQHVRGRDQGRTSEHRYRVRPPQTGGGDGPVTSH